MGWGDAKHLPYCESMKQLDGKAHVERVFREVIAAECETLPQDLIDTPRRPTRAKMSNDIEVEPASHRLRVRQTRHSFRALQASGPSLYATSEARVVAAVASVTEEMKEHLDKSCGGDWRLAAFKITVDMTRTRRMRVADPEHERKIEAYRASRTLTDSSPPKMVMAKVPDESAIIEFVWYDASRSEERKGSFPESPLTVYIQNGYYPAKLQEERDRALTIIRERVASDKSMDPSVRVAELPSKVVEGAMALLESMSIADVASVLKLDISVVERISVMRDAKPRRRKSSEATNDAPTA